MAGEMNVSQAISTLNLYVYSDAGVTRKMAGDAIDVLAEGIDAQATDLAYLRSYVHALESYVPEAARRVAAGEARQQGEDVPQAQSIMRTDAYRPQGA